MNECFRVPGIRLAYDFHDGAGPVVVFCSGYGSDMGGTKAVALMQACRAAGRAFLRFDYAGHGQSGGKFIDGCIGDWTADAAYIIATAIPERAMILVGSSMGGWISLLLAQNHFAPLVRGMVLVAPAPDFTEILIRPSLTPLQRETLDTLGVIYQPSPYGEPTALTQKLLEDGAGHLLLNEEIAIDCPVRVLHGMDDPDVPFEISLRLAACLRSKNVRLNFIKDGDHRLSRDADLLLLVQTVAAFFGQDGSQALAIGRIEPGEV
jgi:pimeloyl-ACP methyl ester carboxylesterase